MFLIWMKFATPKGVTKVDYMQKAWKTKYGKHISKYK